jgi:hypothetical protein
MDNEIIITLAGVLGSCVVAIGFVIRHMIKTKSFPWQKKEK